MKCLGFCRDYFTVVSKPYIGDVVSGEGESRVVHLPANKTLFVIFKEMGFKTQEINYYFGSYSDKEMGVFGRESRGIVPISLSGKFWLRPDCDELLKKLLKVIQEKTGSPPNVSRYDLSFLLQTDDSDTFLKNFRKNTDFKKLLKRSYERGDRLEYFRAENSTSFEVVAYDKHLELSRRKKRKKSDDNYNELFEGKFGAIREGMVRLEFRFQDSRRLEDFTVMLLKGQFKEADQHLFEQAMKRVGLTRKLEDLLRSALTEQTEVPNGDVI